MRSIAMGLLAVGLLAGRAGAEDTMPWQPNLESAQQLAGQTNRLVLLHFWGPHCPPCVQVERQVFSQAATGQALAAQFVAVKLNVDEFPSTARLYGVTRIPTDVILTPSGQIVSKLTSPLEPSQYVAALNQVADSCRRQRRVQPAAATAPLDGSGAWQSPDYGAGNAPAAVDVQRPAQLPERQSRWGSATDSTAPNALAYCPVAERNALSPGGAANYGAPAGGEYRGQVAAAPPQPAAGANPYFAAAPPLGGAGAPPAGPSGLQPAAVQLPPGSPPLVLDGHCPVTLVAGKRWQRGDVRYGAVHRGRTYLFAGPAEQQQFLANPDAFMPMLSGDDPVMAIDHGQQVPGQRKFGAFYQKRVYLFSSEETMNRFTKSPDRYVSVVLQAMNAK